MTQRTGVIIVAGGNGHRMGGKLPKQFRLLSGVPILARTINAFATALPDAPIVVVLPSDYVVFWKNLAARFDIAPHTLATGGAERFHSVRNGLALLPRDVELIAVHDAVRPMVTDELIRRTVAAAAAHGAAIPALVPSDSFREVSGTDSHPLDRKRLRAVQTPQIFDADLLRTAYEVEFSPAFTDDASVVEQTGHPLLLCEGERRNFKITLAEDLLLAEALISADETSKSDADTEPQSTGKSTRSDGTDSMEGTGPAPYKAAADDSPERQAGEPDEPTAEFADPTMPPSPTVRNMGTTQDRHLSDRMHCNPQTSATAKQPAASEPENELFGGGAGAIR